MEAHMKTTILAFILTLGLNTFAAKEQGSGFLKVECSDIHTFYLPISEILNPSNNEGFGKTTLTHVPGLSMYIINQVEYSKLATVRQLVFERFGDWNLEDPQTYMGDDFVNATFIKFVGTSNHPQYRNKSAQSITCKLKKTKTDLEETWTTDIRGYSSGYFSSCSDRSHGFKRALNKYDSELLRVTNRCFNQGGMALPVSPPKYTFKEGKDKAEDYCSISINSSFTCHFE